MRPILHAYVSEPAPGSVSVPVSGAELPPIVFVHGFPMTGEVWAKQLRKLSAEINCHAVDLPGYGLSPEPNGFVASIDTFADSLDNYIAAHHLPPVHLVGISLGGMIALNMARRYPHLLKSIVLLHSTAAADSPALSAERTKIIDSIAVGGLEQFIIDFADVLLGPNASQSVRAHYIKMMNKADKDIVIAGMIALRDRGDETPYLGQIKTPTLVIAGDEDKRTPAEMMQKMANAIPKARFALIENCGHVSPLEQPKELSNLLKDWVRS